MTYVPPTDAERVKAAIWAAGAGSFPGYEHCSSEQLVTGCYTPVEGSHAAVGEVGVPAREQELSVDVVCPNLATARRAKEAMRRAHPYEVPVINFVRMADV